MTQLLGSKSLTRVENVERPSDSYDVAIYASGYEKRATWAAKYAESRGVQCNRVVCLGFDNHTEDEVRKDNDRYFEERGARLHTVPYKDHVRVCDAVASELADLPASARILVDYSSMSRTWISAIAAYLAEAAPATDLEVDWAYSPGHYSSDYREKTRLTEVRRAPGTYGGMGQFPTSLLVCSVGVDPLATEALFQHLEVHNLVLLSAVNPDSPELEQTVLRQHKKYLTMAQLQRIPLRDVALTFTVLRELAQSALPSRNVVFAALGPKPHFLSMVLAGISIRRIHVLHVSRAWPKPVGIECRVDPILTRTALRQTSGAQASGLRRVEVPQI